MIGAYCIVVLVSFVEVQPLCADPCYGDTALENVLPSNMIAKMERAETNGNINVCRVVRRRVG